MGFLKKIFKPVSKVLDKIVPNEIKPALPYLSAFAPMMLGPGIMGSSMLQRGLMSGGLNLLGQLSQEGSEGDVNWLSTALAGGLGALTAPGTKAGLPEGMSPGESMARFGTPDGPVAGTGSFKSFADAGIEKYGAESAGGEILGGLSKASEFLTDPGLLKYGIPAAQGTMDLAYAQALRDKRDLERDQASGDDDNEDANRALAIRQSMEAYGFTEEEILDAIAAAGYKKGGRVGFEMGGLGALGGAMVPEEKEFKFEDIMVSTDQPQGTPLIIKIGEKFNVMIPGEDSMLSFDSEQEAFDYMKKLMPFKKGGRVGFANGGDDTYQMYLIDLEAGIISPDKTFNEYLDDIAPDPDYDKVYKKGGRVALAFGGIDSAVEKVDDVEMKENIKFAQNMDIPMEDLVEEFIIIHKRKPNSLDELKRFYRDKYENKGPADVKIQETMTERFTAEDGGVASVLPKGKEMDYRGGGMIPMGSKERADDVPARLSKNEFVMTADAVRAAGGGSVNEGARRMYNLMNSLEARA